MYQLIGLERLQPLAEAHWRLAHTYRTVTQAWGDTRPYLVNSAIATLKIVVTMAAGAYFMGVAAGKAYRWFAPRLQAAYDAFRDYRETPWYESWEACQDEPAIADPETPIALPAPNAPNEDPYGMDDFDPIPELQPEDWESAEVDEIPTVPDLREEVTQSDVVAARKRRGRPRKAQADD